MKGFWTDFQLDFYSFFTGFWNWYFLKIFSIGFRKDFVLKCLEYSYQRGFHGVWWNQKLFFRFLLSFHNVWYHVAQNLALWIAQQYIQFWRNSISIEGNILRRFSTQFWYENVCTSEKIDDRFCLSKLIEAKNQAFRFTIDGYLSKILHQVWTLFQKLRLLFSCAS